MLARRAYAVASAAAARAAFALRHACSPSVRGPQRQRPQAAHSQQLSHTGCGLHTGGALCWRALTLRALPTLSTHFVPHVQVRPAAAAAGLLSGHALLPAFTTLPASLVVRLGVRAPADGGVGHARASRVLHLGSSDHPRVSLFRLPVALSSCCRPAATPRRPSCVLVTAQAWATATAPRQARPRPLRLPAASRRASSGHSGQVLRAPPRSPPEATWPSASWRRRSRRSWR